MKQVEEKFTHVTCRTGATEDRECDRRAQEGNKRPVQGDLGLEVYGGELGCDDHTAGNGAEDTNNETHCP